MVQMMNSAAAVKFELDDEEDISPLRKRSKLDPAALLEEKESDLPIPPSFYDPLSEPSPLGLSLKKSPSFLDLIQMKLSQQNDSAKFKKKGVKVDALPGNPDKIKASNFPALLLKIGSWEYKSRYEGDLVVKCYFAKHNLVWEILDGELKNKIEIQWSDIVAIKANYSDDDGLGTLDVVLARQPLFFRETNPQPRKHTLWQATSDFTGGQASIHRQHYLQCSQDQLGKHFEKLVQCDPRLNFLSQQSKIVLESPYFEPRVSSFNDTKNGVPLRNEGGPPLFGVLVSGSPTASGSSLGINEQQDFTSRTPEHLYQQTPSPCSDTHAIEEIKSGRTVDATSSLDQWDLSKFRPSMSMTDLMNHIGHCISEQKTYSNPALSGDDLQSREILEEITQYLMADNSQQQHTCASAEKSIMSRVNCLCCLLNKDYEIDTVNADEHNNDGWGSKAPEGVPVSLDDSSDTCSGSKQQPLMSRKDSIGDFILLPRIASLPQFLFNIPEDTENRGR